MIDASIWVGSSRIVAVAVAVAVNPLRAVVRVAVAAVAPTVLVPIGASVGVVSPRFTVGVYAGVGRRSSAVVAETIVVGVVPLRGVAHEGVSAVGGGPLAVGVGIAVPVLVWTARSIVNGRAVEQRAVVIEPVVIAIAVVVAPPGWVVRVGIGAVDDRPTRVGVGVPIAVRVGAASSVCGGVSCRGWAGITVGSTGVVAEAVSIAVGPLRGVARVDVGAVGGGPVGIAV